MLLFYDMRINLIVCVATLVLGVGVLRLLTARKHSRRNHLGHWVPAAALIAGPAIGVAFWALEVFVVSADSYITSYERFDVLGVPLLIGMLVGFVVAAVAALAIARHSTADDR